MPDEEIVSLSNNYKKKKKKKRGVIFECGVF